MFARLVGVELAQVAVGSTVSELVGSVVAALPEGARIVVPDIEFTSTLFPLNCDPPLVAAHVKGHRTDSLSRARGWESRAC